jgi:hypothetical protein
MTQAYFVDQILNMHSYQIPIGKFEKSIFVFYFFTFNEVTLKIDFHNGI